MMTKNYRMSYYMVNFLRDYKECCRNNSRLGNSVMICNLNLCSLEMNFDHLRKMRNLMMSLRKKMMMTMKILLI